jgi:DNA (cytosine-5)-methyltransferase 1
VIYGSVCSGIEAATVAWEGLGWRAAWFAEIDSFASAVLAHRFPEVANLGDFTQIQAGAGAVDVLVGGTPCQSFSVAGRRLGVDDPRGNLTLEYLRLAARLRPRWVIWENVPGILSIDGGRTFGTVLGTLAHLGYGIAYRVLDAQFFGVSQRRRRVFVVGHSGGWQAAAAVLFERESLRRDLAPRRKKEEVVAAITANSLGTCGSDPKQAQAGHILPAAVVGQSVSAKWAKRSSGPSGNEYHNLIAETLEPIPRAVAFSCKDHGADATEDIAPTLRAMPHHRSHANAGGQLAAVIFESRFARNGRGAPDVVAPPLKAFSGTSGRGDGAPLLATWVAVRRLTPRECERLQGFPDDWTLIPNYRCRISPPEIADMAEYLNISFEEATTLGVSPDGPRYKAIGNSMAVPVMRWIGRRVDAVEQILRRAA